MKPRSYLVFLSLLAISAILVWYGIRASEKTNHQKDFFLITVDTLRADRLGYMGYDDARTPHLDALARSGTSFTQTITPMPRTTPALATLHTGLWPHRHGSREVGDPIQQGVRLAEILRARGYRTIAVSANATAGPAQGLDRGFDTFVTYEDLIARQGENLYRDLTQAPATATGWATATTNAALKLLNKVDRSTPVFLWIFYFDPHFLYRPPSPWQDETEASKCWQLYAWGKADLSRGGQVFYNRDGVASQAVDHCSALYDAEVSYTDHELGRLLEGVDQERELDSSVVVFTADHGENLGEQGLFFEHGDNLHDAGLRVPLVFRGPGIQAGATSTNPASLADVGDTVLSLLGIPRPDNFEPDGSDLSAMLRPGSTQSSRQTMLPTEPSARVVFAESASAMYREATDRLVTGRRGGQVCLNGPRFTLCESQRVEPGVFRLYDREEDPDMVVDQAAQHAEVVEELLQAWQRWPPESARLLAARTPQHKLIRTPRLEGGYHQRLVDLTADPAEETDISTREPAVVEQLGEALDTWTVELAPIYNRSPNPAVERALRSLGYIQ